MLLWLGYYLIIVASILISYLSFFRESENSVLANTGLLNVADTSAEFFICYLLLTSFLNAVFF